MKPVTDQLTQDEIGEIITCLGEVINKGIDGDVVEMGCFEGGSAVAMQQMLKTRGYPKQLWLYDSFEGLPEKTAEDEAVRGVAFRAGALKASRARLLRNFTKFDLRQPEVKRAWFWELESSDLPEQIALAFLDGDYYESILDSLRLVWPKLSRGGVVLVDDYNNATLPGVKKAVDEWASAHNVPITINKTIAMFTLGDQV